MTTWIYHKIHAPFKRHTSGPERGSLIGGDWSLPEFEYLSNNNWEFTEKVDGTNIRIHLIPGTHYRPPGVRIGGRTDRAQIPPALLTVLTDMFGTERSLSSRWESAFEDAGDQDEIISLYGEGYGPGINGGGKYRRGGVSFVLFDVKVGDWWLSRENVNDIAGKMGLESVPIVGHGTLFDGMELVSSGLESGWGPFLAEGVVARPLVPLFNRKGERILTKIKSVDFMEKSVR